jgi:lipopolysaccharide export LptBFGC system permease protein LptF
MFLRLARLRFVVVRSCFISIIIILFLQFVAFFNHDDFQSTTKNKIDDSLSSNEKLFWKKLADEDAHITEKQRIKGIQLNQNQTEKTKLNWKNIFSDIYQRKIAILNERDTKTPYKYRNNKHEQNIQQKTFEIFEETPVRYTLYFL